MEYKGWKAVNNTALTVTLPEGIHFHSATVVPALKPAQSSRLRGSHLTWGPFKMNPQSSVFFTIKVGLYDGLAARNCHCTGPYIHT